MDAIPRNIICPVFSNWHIKKLTLKALSKIVRDDTLKFNVNFSEKIRLNISCELSVAEDSHAMLGLIFYEK